MEKIIAQLDKEKKPILINNILPFKENRTMMEILSSTGGWHIGYEGIQHSKTNFHTAYTKGYQHMGMTFTSAKPGHENFTDSALNIYGKIIANIIAEKLDFNFKRIYRMFWNYYVKGQEGVGHYDLETENNISIVYNLMNTDGGTEILKQFYPDICGQAKIFKSNWWHRGVTTKEDKARVILNIVLD